MPLLQQQQWHTICVNDQGNVRAVVVGLQDDCVCVCEKTSLP